MSTRKLSNIPVKEFRKFLESQGLNIIKDARGRGGHEKWIKNFLRSIQIAMLYALR